MRLAVFSDIHGNAHALDAAMDNLATVGEVEQVWFLGDMAAFGPYPAACIRRVRQVCETLGDDRCHVIGGNTDRYLVTGERFRHPPAADESAFNALLEARLAVDAALNWGLSQLAWEDYSFLAQYLGKELRLDVPGYGPVIGYHAIPGDDEGWLLPDTPDEEAADCLLDRECVLGIGGHIHQAFDRRVGGRRVVNVGSVGMSFEQPGRAQWALFTFADGDVSIDFRAAPYDTQAFIADFDTVGYPVPEWGKKRFRLG